MMIKTTKRGFYFSKKELKDLTKSWFILSLAFAIALKGFSLNLEFITAFMISAITVGTAFIFHELGHKFLAQHYGCFAEFRSFDTMLGLALLMSFLGFIFAAPGAVMISGPIGKIRNGKISAIGPLTNIILALIFLLITWTSQSAIIQIIGHYGFLINSWLALFNLIPFSTFDGKKSFTGTKQSMEQWLQ